MDGKYRIVNPCSKNDEQLGHAGIIIGYSPIYINRLYAEADLKMLTGFIEPLFSDGTGTEEKLRYGFHPSVDIGGTVQDLLAQGTRLEQASPLH